MDRAWGRRAAPAHVDAIRSTPYSGALCIGRQGWICIREGELRGFAWLILAIGLTVWSSSGFAGVSPNTGAQSQSGAKIKPPQQEHETDRAPQSKQDDR